MLTEEEVMDYFALAQMLIKYGIMAEAQIEIWWKASAELKAALAKARAAGTVTDAQWAELDAALTESEERRRAMVANWPRA